jgi:hypothetical protein
MEEKPKDLEIRVSEEQEEEQEDIRASIFKNPSRETSAVPVTPEQAIEFQSEYYKKIVEALSEETQSLLKLCKVLISHLPQKKQNEATLKLREIIHVASIKLDFFNNHEVPTGPKGKMRKLN